MITLMGAIMTSNTFANIEKERTFVEGNRELIRIYEAKIKQVIEKVWEG